MKLPFIILLCILASSATAAVVQTRAQLNTNTTPSPVLLGNIIASFSNLMDNNAYAGYQSFNAGFGGIIAVSPNPTVTPADLGLYINETLVGSCSSTCEDNIMSIADTISQTPLALGWSWQYTFANASMVGNRTAFQLECEQGGTTGNSTGNGGVYTCDNVIGLVTANDNGTGGVPRGTMEVQACVLEFGPSATNWNFAQCEEIDTLLQAGSSTNNKISLTFVQLPGDQVQGTTNDADILFANNGPIGVGSSDTVGVKYSLQWGNTEAGSFWPLTSSSIAMGCVSCGAIGTVLDFSGATISNYLVHGPGSYIDGVGNGGLKTATLTPQAISAILAISCTGGTNKGMLAWVSDTVGSAAPTFHLILAAGGATTVSSLVSCNGTNWVYD